MKSQSVALNRALLIESIMVFGLLLCATLAIEISGMDTHLADIFYGWEDNQWQLKNAWVTSVLIHKYGKYLSILLLLVVISLWTSSYFISSLAVWKYRLRYVLIASISGALLVSIGKSLSNISCPWDFSRYGGSLEYIPLLEQLWVRNGSHCFPAGHASAGFAWVSLYFVGRHLHATWRWWVLAGALLLGTIFGVSQQLRGAHFISHDLWSFGTCWMVSLICYHTLLKSYELSQ